MSKTDSYLERAHRAAKRRLHTPGPAPLPPSEKRSSPITFLVTPDERKVIEQVATVMGESVSTYVRKTVLARVDQHGRG